MSDVNVPAGYRNTEVGIIPEDWSIASINDCSVKIGSGKTPTGGSSVYVNSGRPFIRSQNVGWGKLKLSDVAYITEEIHSSFLGSEIEESDVLLNITGASIGRCTKADTRISGGNVNQHVCIIRTDNTKLIPNLLVDLINSNSGQKQIDSYQAGGNREGLNFSQVRQLKFAIAKSTEEQTAIATALSDVENLIQSLERLIAKKEAIKTATMQQLLTGKTRLSEFATREDGSQKEFKQTDLGQIPEDWDILEIGKDATLKARIGWQALTTNEYLNNGNYYLVTGTDFNAGEVQWDTCWHIDAWRYKQDRNIQLRSDDVLVTKDGTVGKVGYIEKLAKPATLNSGVFVIRAQNQKFKHKFLFYIFTSIIFREFIRNITAGSTITHLYQKDFVKFRFQAPSIEEQNAIATILSNMDTEIQALRDRLTKTQDIKQGMMQQLLTGKVRLAH